MPKMENTQEQLLVTSVAAKLDIVITSYCEFEIEGYLYNPFSDRCLLFGNTLELLLKMGEMFDHLKFPQSSVEYRSFYNSKRGREKSPIQEETQVNEMNASESAQAKFIVHVQYRQNATWQGTIQWVDENKTQRFRSTLEMLRLMEEALDSKQDTGMNSFQNSEDEE